LQAKSGAEVTLNETLVYYNALTTVLSRFCILLERCIARASIAIEGNISTVKSDCLGVFRNRFGILLVFEEGITFIFFAAAAALLIFYLIE
jgi:hypothetical protein